MEISQLDFDCPPDLVATEPRRPSRVLLSEAGMGFGETSPSELLRGLRPQDLLVVNDTKVLPVRVWSLKGDEVLFVHRHSDLEWDVLFMAREYRINDAIEFPGGVHALLSAKGLPQRLRLQQPLSAEYFEKHGEPALPPYIQAARGERHARPEDSTWYQTAWAAKVGSSAAPTASLHFNKEQIEELKKLKQCATLTLHVGLGTFLPIKTSNLDAHLMHAEAVSIPEATLQAIEKTKSQGGRVWALGTTVTRALESWGLGMLQKNASAGVDGDTNLFIKPGFEFKVVDQLLTNFHQPRSTLLALVMAFAGEERVREGYKFAIDHKFRLFSYGDLSAWNR